MTTTGRKDDHIQISLARPVSAHFDHWDDVYLHHQAVPSRDLDRIDLSVELLGKHLDAPLVISSMTGGSREAAKYNRMMARAAEEFGIGMGVGSQRAGLEDPRYERSYAVVKEFQVPLVLGNLGAPQMASRTKGGRKNEHPYGPVEFQRAVEMIDADAVCIHLNYLQEIVQPEGDRFVEGFPERLREICLKVPVVAKETGAGISRTCALLMKDVGAKAIDVGGMGGTSFSAVESYRGGGRGSAAARLGSLFWDWGVPTPVSLRLADVGLPLIATGGIRNGLDAARAMALGATAAGMSWKLLKAASKDYRTLENEISSVIDELRSALFLSGVGSAKEASRMNAVITGRTKEILDGIMSNEMK